MAESIQSLEPSAKMLLRRVSVKRRTRTHGSKLERVRSPRHDPKLRHSGADKNDPNYNVYQEMQSPNDSSTAQLVAMSYNGDLPKAEFKEDHINKQKETSVTVPNTLASQQQQALAKSKTYARNHVQSS